MRRRDLENVAQSDLGKEVGTEIKRALQLRAVDAEQAKVDDAKADAVAKLIAAAEYSPTAVIQVGALLLVEVKGALSVRDLTPREITMLRQNPHLVTEPASLLAELQTSAAGESSTIEH